MEWTTQTPGEEKPWRFPLRVASAYILVASVWILFSDQFVAAIASTPESLAKMQAYKGLGFVLVTTLLLFLLLCNESRRRLKREQTIHQQATLLDLADAAVVVFRWNGPVTYWNSGAERLYGWSKREALGKRLSELFTGHAGMEAWSGFESTLIEQGYWRGERHQITRDGRRLEVDVQLTLVRSAQNEPESVICVGLDGTKRKWLEKQLLQAQKLESLGSLAAGISHDFNNLLAVVNGYSEMLLISPEPNSEDRRRMVEQIQAAAHRGTGLVRKISTFVRSRDPVKSEIDLAEQIKELVAMLGATFPSNIKITTEIEENLPRIIGDSDQLQQVVLNLCVNARDAMAGEGKLTVRLRQANYNEAIPGGGANQLCLEVRDTGKGIPLEVQSTLFEPFVTTKGAGQGTGLGLSVVDGIVRSHGGWINIRSSKDSGTSFFVYLPTAGTEKNQGTERYTPEGGGTTPEHTQGKTVVVIDSVDSACRSAAEPLREHGYRVLSDLTVALADTEPTRTEPTAVVLDVDGSAMRADALLSDIRTKAPDVPVLVIVDSVSESEERNLFLLGAADVLKRPYGILELVTALEEALIVSEKGTRPLASARPDSSSGRRHG